MRIAFIVPYVPNLIRARPYNLIRALIRRGHAVSVFTTYSGEPERTDAGRLAQMGARVTAWPAPRWRSAWNMISALPSDVPLQAAFSWLPQLAERAISEVVAGDFDIVHVEHLRGARYALHLKDNSSPVPVIWDSVDCISYLFEQAAASSSSARWRMLASLDLARTRRYEALIRDRADRTLITSEIDRRALAALPGRSSRRETAAQETIAVVPNGVDLDYFTPSGEERDASALVFSGKMSYHANVTAAQHLLTEIMPLVWSERPDAHLWIVGKDPAPVLHRSAARHPGRVTITGSVPDIRPYLRRAALSVAPIVYGAGSQYKILEAMACATPVVAARRAIAALAATDRRELFVFDDAAEAAEQIVRLLSQPDLAARVGQAGLEYVERYHRWDAIAGRLEGIYGESISGKLADTPGNG